MNSHTALLLLTVCSSAYAELPPVIAENAGDSTQAAPSIAKAPAVLSSNYEMMKRIEQMQVEIQQLTGKVEEQTFQIEELKKQQKTMFTDFDDRIQAIENKSGAAQPTGEVPPSDTTSPAETTAPPTVPVAPEQSDSSNQSQLTAPETTTAPPVAAEKPTAETASPPSTNTAEVSASEKQEYQEAYDNLRNGRTDQSITGFTGYLANHPTSAYASNAQYWLGEAYRANLDNTSARQAFNSVIEKFPQSAKVPDALLKLGYIEMEEKNSAKAREILTRINSEYPNTKAAALAQKKLQILDKSAP